MQDHLDPHVEPERPDQAAGHTMESGEVPADDSCVSGVDGQKQEDDKRERSSAGDADANGEERGVAQEEEESCEEEEKSEEEDEQDDLTKIKTPPCILEGGDIEAQHVKQYIIARKYVHVSKLILDEELKYGRSGRVQRPCQARLRRSVAHQGRIEEVHGYLQHL